MYTFCKTCLISCQKKGGVELLSIACVAEGRGKGLAVKLVRFRV